MSFNCAGRYGWMVMRVGIDMSRFPSRHFIALFFCSMLVSMENSSSIISQPVAVAKARRSNPHLTVFSLSNNCLTPNRMERIRTMRRSFVLSVRPHHDWGLRSLCPAIVLRPEREHLEGEHIFSIRSLSPYGLSVVVFSIGTTFHIFRQENLHFVLYRHLRSFRTTVTREEMISSYLLPSPHTSKSSTNWLLGGSEGEHD